MKCPKNWTIRALEEVAEIQTGISVSNERRTANPIVLPYLRVANVQDGWIDLSDIKTICIEKDSVDRYKLIKGDVLLTEGGDYDKLGRGTVWEGQIDLCVHQNHIFAVRANADALLPTYLAAFSAGPVGRHYFLSCSKQTTNLASINATQLRQFPIFLPPMREQIEICRILKCCENQIDQCLRVIDSKRLLKKALMQQLLTGKRRFKEFKEPWRKVRIGEVLEEVSRPIEFDDEVLYELISVRRRSGGIFSRENLYGREILTKNLYTAKAGDFLISKMQVVHGALGLVTPEFDGKAISGSYIAMVSKNSKVLDMEFFNYLSQMPLMYRLAYISSYGVHIEKMTFNLDLFLKEKILIPPTSDEQARIVSVIDAAQCEIKVLETQLEAIKLQKRGLMQKLLTGKVRVKL
jgi:type I restriction enzyme, S subunit